MTTSRIIAAAALSFLGAGMAQAQGFQGSEVDAGYVRATSDGEVLTLKKVEARTAYGLGGAFGVQGDFGYTDLDIEEFDSDLLSFRVVGRYDATAALSFGLGAGRLAPVDSDDGDALPFYSFQALYLDGPARVEGGLTRYDDDGDHLDVVTLEGHYEVAPGLSKVYGGLSRLSFDDDHADLLTAGYEQGFGSFDLHGELTRTRIEDVTATGVFVGGTVDLSPDVELYGELGRVTSDDEHANALGLGLRWQLGRAKNDGLFSSPLNELDFAGF